MWENVGGYDLAIRDSEAPRHDINKVRLSWRVVKKEGDRPFSLVYCDVLTGCPASLSLAYKIDESDLHGRKDVRPVILPVLLELERAAVNYLRMIR